ncbi:MAG TPA: hypothetical protein VN837_04625 [Chloroflexota bacterium]|nr:hypothetical protein [Chloroflexota bacterium]
MIGPLRLVLMAMTALAILLSSAVGVERAAANAATRGAGSPTPQAPQPASAYPTVVKVRPSAPVYALTLSGTAVNFNLSGLEPDFDPIYKLIVSAKLRDRRSKPLALPDANLILSAYIEVFQPDTTPILPDLLHPNQVANNLAGFLSGAVALVNIGGRVVYRGSLVGEIFQDSTESLVIDLEPISPTGTAPPIRLQGAIVLHKGGDESGTLQALTALSPAALAVPHGPMPTWQAVVDGMSVHTPAMMGTAGTPGQKAPAKAATIAPMSPTQQSPVSCDLGCRLRRPTSLIGLALGGVVLLVGLITGWRRMRRGSKQPA